ncbi:MAG: cation:proton antiporter [Bacteriovoracia bacterium]
MENHVLNVLAITSLLLFLAKIFSSVLNKIFGKIKLDIPSVLIELGLGVTLSFASGPLGIESDLKTLLSSDVIVSFSELGILFLLFYVGLETDFKQLAAVKKDAILVAVTGVILPVASALLVLSFISEIDFKHQSFLAAALAATSIGITARVLSDLGLLKSKSGQIILGAAVIDDILGIGLLTAVTIMVSEKNSQSLSVVGAKIGLFFGFVYVLRAFLLPKMMKFIENNDHKLVILISFCLFGSFLAQKLGLAAIIGAFTMGVALHNEKNMKLIHPIAETLSPIFFILIGANIQLGDIQGEDIWLKTILLCLCAILGKFFSGFAARSSGIDRTLMGIGMIPRGEVGLIFASIGLSLGALKSSDYVSIIIMVAVTTFLTPLLLSIRAKK